ncbi:MAG: flagellar biosynthetic protein FliP [Planctomycetota bacterium]|nr:MAG: flagellar biosynthetic protein FliP [Planctomycetota bacterium]
MLALSPGAAKGQEEPPSAPQAPPAAGPRDAGERLGGTPEGFRVRIDGPSDGDDLAATLKIALALTLLSLAPAILVTATSFTRIIIVLGFVRVGLQTPNMPPTQVVVGLALFLTALSMGPTVDAIDRAALAPYRRGELKTLEALERAQGPLRDFLLRHTRERSLAAFVELARVPEPLEPREVPLRVLLPAFVVSELTTAFEMGVVILIPFLVIDIVASSVLLAMNMIMLPPATIATPMKVLLFVLVDGWQLVATSLVRVSG